MGKIYTIPLDCVFMRLIETDDDSADLVQCNRFVFSSLRFIIFPDLEHVTCGRNNRSNFENCLRRERGTAALEAFDSVSMRSPRQQLPI